MNLQRRVAFLPYAQVWRKTARKSDIPDDPQTLGEHLRTKRHELGLYQKEVAAELDVNEWTVGNWEKDRTTPPVRMWPRIIEFLSFDPYPPPRDEAERIRSIRRNLGFSVKQLAANLHVNESTVTRWERNLNKPSSDSCKRIVRLLGNVRD